MNQFVPWSYKRIIGYLVIKAKNPIDKLIRADSGIKNLCINDSTILNLEIVLDKFPDLECLFINYCKINELGDLTKHLEKINYLRISYELMLQLSSTKVATLILYNDHLPGIDDTGLIADIDIIVSRFPNVRDLALYNCARINLSKPYPVNVVIYSQTECKKLDLENYYNFRKLECLLQFL